MRWWPAPAKVNLALHVRGRRPGGYHELQSAVAFAGICDWLGYESGAEFALRVEGPRASASGPLDQNLVSKAVRALARRFPGLQTGRFRLIKRLPVAAGLGGGSADAAAALRALASQNSLPLRDDRLLAAALETGADVPVCLFGRACIVEGVGEKLRAPFSMPDFHCVLVNPGVEAPTRRVFETFDREEAGPCLGRAIVLSDGRVTADALIQWRNDLQPAALRVAPDIGEVLGRLSRLPGVELTRMTGSGATCFALFENRNAAAKARRSIAEDHPGWWVEIGRLQ